MEEQKISFGKAFSWWLAAVLSFLGLTEGIRFLFFDSPIRWFYILGMAILSALAYVAAYRFIKKDFEPMTYKQMLGEVVPFAFAVIFALLVITIMVSVMLIAIFT